MFNYIFTLFISIAISPTTAVVNSPEELKNTIINYIQDLSTKSAAFVPVDIEQKFQDIEPFASSFFETKNKIKIYIFTRDEVEQNKKTSEVFGMAHSFASIEMHKANRLAKSESVLPSENMGFLTCFRLADRKKMQFESRKNLMARSTEISSDSSISTGRLSPLHVSDCIANYWGATSIASSSALPREAFEAPQIYQQNLTDQFIAVYQEKTGRLLLMMSSAATHETLEVFAINNFDKNSKDLLDFFRSALKSEN